MKNIHVGVNLAPRPWANLGLIFIKPLLGASNQGTKQKLQHPKPHFKCVKARAISSQSWSKGRHDTYDPP